MIKDSVSYLFYFSYISFLLHSDQLPYSVRILLESAVRNCDEFNVQGTDVERILDWVKNQEHGVDIPFKPARVILQDFT